MDELEYTIENERSLHSKDKKGYDNFYSGIKKVFDIVLNDVKNTFLNFFPFFADKTALYKMNKMWNFLFLNENEDDIRKVLVNAYENAQHTGEMNLLIKYLEYFFSGRFEYKDLSLKSWRIGYNKIGNIRIGKERSCVIKIKNLTSSERQQIKIFLDEFLDPDVYYDVVEYFNKYKSKIGYFKIGYIKIGRV